MPVPPSLIGGPGTVIRPGAIQVGVHRSTDPAFSVTEHTDADPRSASQFPIASLVQIRRIERPTLDITEQFGFVANECD